MGTGKIRRHLVRRRRGSLAALCLMVCLALSGCAIGASVDSLLKPPSLSDEQEQIYLALQEAVGSNITLQYPRSGTNLSAFTVVDLDDDGEDEAVVFYEKQSLTAAENSLRIGVLDQVGHQWRSVCDLPAEGTQIECVEIAAIGRGHENRIFFGYSGADQSDKLLTVYSYADGVMTQLFRTGYSMFQVADFDADYHGELLVLSRATDNAAASASMYRLDGEEMSLSGKLELRTAFTDYSQIALSHGGDTLPDIFVDGVVSAGMLQTEILHVEEGTLAYVLPDAEAVADTARTVGLLSRDIDGDGSVEIPVQESFPGYEEDASEQVRLTRWMGLWEEQLMERRRGYYSLSDGCMFFLPMAWYGTVTAATDTLTGDIVFYRYDGAFSEDMTELMRYGTVTDSEELSDRQDEGYVLLFTRGNAAYCMRAADTNDPLAISWQNLLPQYAVVD